MSKKNVGLAPFIYLSIITISSVMIIAINAILDLNIPFSVHFLIAFVGLLFIYVLMHSIRTKGWKKTLILLISSFLLAFTAEALGVNFGLVFGHYYYTDVLGFKVMGVPLLAALAWEPILYASFSITDILVPSHFNDAKSFLSRLPVNMWLAVVGALATTAWDMMIDPIAVNEGWWVWLDGGSYASSIANGVPISNFLGWLFVSFLIQLIYRLIIDYRPNVRDRSVFLTLYGPIVLYASLFLTSIGVTITVLNNSEVALIGLFAMAPFLALALTTLNLVQQGLSILTRSEWIDRELSEKHV